MTTEILALTRTGFRIERARFQRVRLSPETLARCTRFSRAILKATQIDLRREMRKCER